MFACWADRALSRGTCPLLAKCAMSKAVHPYAFLMPGVSRNIDRSGRSRASPSVSRFYLSYSRLTISRNSSVCSRDPAHTVLLRFDRRFVAHTRGPAVVRHTHRLDADIVASLIGSISPSATPDRNPAPNSPYTLDCGSGSPHWTGLDFYVPFL